MFLLPFSFWIWFHRSFSFSFVLFSYVMTIFSVMFGLLFYLCVCIYCRLLVYISHEVLIQQSICIHGCFKLLVSFSNAIPISCICALLFSWLLVLMSYLCVESFLTLLEVCLDQWGFLFLWFCDLPVSSCGRFCSPCREVAFAFLVRLVWSCYILLAFASDFFLKSEWQPCWVEYSWLYAFPLHHSRYIMSLPSDLQNICWKISWKPYGDSLICYLLLFFFPCCF